ncbi:hypothetical protein RUM43_004452 [Polyplax serrata]|uniref:Uncharacterized protein n=1 Tax=Polyplax serrata TaxID=468196 RepID=A0AAN8SD27_POLSC
MSTESKDEGSLENEQESLSEEGEYFDYPNYYCPEEDDREDEFLYPKWRNVPRSPSNFCVSKTTISSCRDSDYERWLENYYNELVLKSLPSYAEKECDTSDLMDTKKPQEIFTSKFPCIRNEPWEICTKYWGPHDIRRHYPILKGHGEYLFIPSIYPNLNLRSRYGRFQSLLYTAAAIPEESHKVKMRNIFKMYIDRAALQNPKLLRVISNSFLYTNLYSLKWYDFVTKKGIMRRLCKFFKTQRHLEKVYFEDADLKRMEAIILLCALSRSGGSQIKELHMWKMFGYGQCPLLMSELPERGSSGKFYFDYFGPCRVLTGTWFLSVRKAEDNKSMEFFTRIHYLQILYKFSSLTHLSVNYAYLANPEGDALLCVRSLRNGVLRELRILCLKEERPLLTNPAYGVGGWLIPDGVWRRATEWCPDLRVKFVFVNVPQYENIVLFLSKSIPVSSVNISTGPIFDFEVPWDLDSTLLELRNWYSSTLVSLTLHLWHHRDLLDFVIKSKILDEFPNLVHFEFIGVLEDVETLNAFCCQLSKGIYKLKNLLFWVEERYTNRKKLETTRRRVQEIRETFRKKFLVIDIDADIRTYAM